MRYPKSFRQQQDEVAAAIDALLMQRRRERMIKKIELIAKHHRPGQGRVMLRRIRQYLRNGHS